MTKQTNITTDTATAVIEYIPLAELTLSPLNPRQDVSAEGIDLLADSLVTCGLIQNLGGLRAEDGSVAIVAGGRRLRALQIAVEQRPDLALVPVQMAPSLAVALEWASAENTAREELDPVDEVRAYGKMAATDKPLAHISRAFGVTEAHVRRRLALAGLPEAVLDALKAGDISMGIAKAMTVGEDEKAILEVLERAKGNRWINEHQIRSDLKPLAVKSTDRRAAFVTVETYKAAGGLVTQDLFEDETLLNSPDILDALFAEKLAFEAERIKEAEGLAWIKTVEESGVYWWELQEKEGFARIYKEEGVLSDAQEVRYGELEELGNGDALNAEGEAELAALEAILEGDYSAEQKAISGAMIFVRHDGTLDRVCGLVAKEQQEQAIADGLLTASAHSNAGPQKEKPAYSQKFVDDMQAIRLAAVQTAMLEKPEFVLDLLAFALSPASGYYSNVLGVRFDPERNTPEIDDAFALSSRIGGPISEAEEEAEDQLEGLARNGMPEAFAAFCAMGKKHRNAQITQSFARAFKSQKPDFMAPLEEEAGADIRSIWTPTATNCFKRLNGAQLDTLFSDLLDLPLTDAAYKTFASSKKGAKVEAMHGLFHDPEQQEARGVTPAQKARIDQWVPECF